MIQNQPTKLTSRRTAIRVTLFTSLAVACLPTACSSVKHQVYKGTVKGRTFSFLTAGPRELPSYAEERQEAHHMVQQAIIKNLAAKGLAYTPSGGDVTVAYLIVVGNNSTTTSLNDYFGYTADTEAFVNRVHSEQTGNKDARGYFEAGTLVIDFVNPATSKLLQRRSIRAEVLRNLPAETRSARVQEVVDQALKDVSVTR